MPVSDKVLTDCFETDIAKHFDVTVISDASYFLGIRIQRNRDPDSHGLALDQAQFTKTILKCCNHDPTQITSTPLSPLERLILNAEPVLCADSEGIQTWPGTEGWGVGSMSG